MHPDRGSDLWSKMFHYYNFKREEFMAHYQQRSNVETVFQMIKISHAKAQRAAAFLSGFLRLCVRNSFLSAEAPRGY
jgi:hypothetical protein